MGTEFNKVALSINAHPDDAEAWNAGVLKLLRDRGYKIVIATMTGGDLGGCNMSMEETARYVLRRRKQPQPFWMPSIIQWARLTALSLTPRSCALRLSP
ncbi:MAG: hypothetical protein R2756_04310 [Bacteroidales bacterium]